MPDSRQSGERPFVVWGRMPKPDRSRDRPGVVDLNARRRAAEVQKQALKAAARSAPKPAQITSLTAWGVLLLAAAAWTAVTVLLA